MAIPIAAGDNHVIGFGGAHYTDRQRGAMVYRLDDVNGIELNTRLTIAAAPHSASPLATEGFTLAQNHQLVSFVDIPATAPEGTHTLHVSRRLEDGSEVPGPPYDREIKILPHTIAAGGETIVGQFTPLGLANCSWNCGFAHLTEKAIPRPRIQLAVSGDSGTDRIGSFTLDLTYPTGVINIIDAVESSTWSRNANNTGMIWAHDDEAGQVQISGVAHPDETAQGYLYLWNIEIVFELDSNQGSILDISQIQVSSLVAYDVDGNPIPASADEFRIR